MEVDIVRNEDVLLHSCNNFENVLEFTIDLKVMLTLHGCISLSNK